MCKPQPSHFSKRAACAILAWVLLFLAAGYPVAAMDAAASRSANSPSEAWVPCQSGEACLPPGDASLPAALTGVSARGAVLMEADSGDIVFGQNQNTRLPMASTTKIMTALVALEKLPLETVVTITPASVGIEGSSIYLVEGEKLTLEQLLYALLLASANDAATAIAVAVAGSVEAFAALMNDKAADLGLVDTHFVNPHGLDHEEHYTTAKELALITRAALKSPVFREICSTKRKTIPLHGDEGVRLLLNHNKLLDAYEGCIGVKTGYTQKTGRCLVSAAQREGVTLIAVTLGAPNDWQDHSDMLDYGFGAYQSISLCNPAFFSAPLWTVSGTQDYVMVENTDELSVTLRRDHGAIHCVVELPRFTFAPVFGGQEVGLLRFIEKRADGTETLLGTVPLYTTYHVEEERYPNGLWDWIRSLFMR